MKIKIEVTKEHIWRGVHKHGGLCMIAQALKDQIPDCKNPRVDTGLIRWTDDKTKERIYIETPEIARKKLLAFDAKKIPRAFIFELDLDQAEVRMLVHQPNEAARLRAYRRNKDGYKKRTFINQRREFGACVLTPVKRQK